MMEQLVSEFGLQLSKAVEIANNFHYPKPSKEYRNVVVTGLGGSGIGGKIVSQILATAVKMPVVPNHHYTIPHFVSEHTLVIVCSYSGNTEETCEAMERAREQGADLFCITSGGTILERAKEYGLPFIQIPGGQPPRSALGFSVVQIMRVFEMFGFMDNMPGVINGAVELLKQEREDIVKRSSEIAEQLVGKMPIIYSDQNSDGAAIRWRQQLNENAKILCWHHALPEMNHNELVGWAGAPDNTAVIILRNHNDHPRTQMRMEVSKEIISKHTDTIIEIFSKGSNPFERAMYLIHFGDWVSVKLSDLLKVDNMEVDVIDYLKGTLAEMKA